MSDQATAGYLHLPTAPDRYRYDYRGTNPAESTYDYRPLRDQYAKPLALNSVVPNQPQQGMSADEYERALLAHLAPHTEQFSRVDVARMPLSRIAQVRDQIVREAERAPERRGELSSFTYQDHAGREVTEFSGAKSSWMDTYKAPGFNATFIGPRGKAYSRVSEIPLSAPTA